MEKDNTLRDVNRQDIIMRPKCNSGTANDMHVMYSATGFLLPCCLCDSSKENHDQFALLGFFDEELKVENVDSFSDIVTSEVWNDFYDMFEDNPHGLGLPHECLKFCGVSYVHNLINDNSQRTG